MPRLGKRYICVDLDFWEDAEDMGLTLKAERLFLRGLAECYRKATDGVISRSTLRRLGGNGYQHSVQLLLRCGLLEEKERDLFWIPSWNKWNESMEDVSARRAADRQRKRLKKGIPPNAFRIPD
jgi:hypothetical protein